MEGLELALGAIPLIPLLAVWPRGGSLTCLNLDSLLCKSSRTAHLRGEASEKADGGERSPSALRPSSVTWIMGGGDQGVLFLCHFTRHPVLVGAQQR